MVAIPTTPLLDAARKKGLHVADIGRRLDVDRHTAALWLVGLRQVPEEAISDLAALLGVPDATVRDVPAPFEITTPVGVRRLLDGVPHPAVEPKRLATQLRQRVNGAPARLRLLTAGEAVAVAALLDEFSGLCPEDDDLGQLAQELADRIRHRLRL
jgi:hypothetical protein